MKILAKNTQISGTTESRKCKNDFLVSHQCAFCSATIMNVYSHPLSNLAWLDEDAAAPQKVNKAIANKCEAQEDYIQLIIEFALAIKHLTYWNKNKDQKVTELLTVSDEAFLIVCLISYGPHWITMHKNLVATQDNSDVIQEKLRESQYDMNDVNKNLY